ncbi:MAG: glycoside hydrolase family 2 TIM barrel-domain containing protein [Rikenellaceae bacterium]
MKRHFIICLLLISVMGAQAQRIVNKLENNWNFNYGWEFVDRSTLSQSVNIPHTWNLDALSGQSDYYRGMGSYIHELDIPKEWNGTKEVYIRFGGVNHTTEVYVNGRRVGSHVGGHSAFGFNITPYLNFSGSNTLWVRASNAQNLQSMPLTGSFNNYGGIYRDVELIATVKTHISHTQYATSGVKVTPMTVTSEKASVNISAEVEGTVGSTVDLRFVLRDESGVKIDSIQKTTKISADGKGKSQWAANITKPRLWNGRIDPYMYSVDVIALSQPTSSKKNAAADKDSVRQSFGLRTFEVNSNNEFMLNGKKYPVRGVTLHSDDALRGNAIRYEEMERDVALICEMGATAVRIMNGAADSKFLELCDRAGLLVWSEIPFVGPGKYRDTGYNNSDEFKENGITQLEEMLAQQYNNPSVVFVGIFNEISQRGDDPLAYIKLLNSTVKDSSGGRLSVGASNQDGDINFVTDLIGFNLYLGWEEGQPEDFEGWADGVRSQWSRLRVGLSEYGAGGSIYQHESTPTRPNYRGAWHPEEWQTYLHHTYLKRIESSGQFWGTFASSLSDWGVAHYRTGDRMGVSDMGLTTFDRGVRKDAFYLYKANWNKDEPMVYISSRRRRSGRSSLETIDVFSNADSVSLVVNDSTYTRIGSDGVGVFSFKDCVLDSGKNIIKAIGDNGVEDGLLLMINH